MLTVQAFYTLYNQLSTDKQKEFLDKIGLSKKFSVAVVYGDHMHGSEVVIFEGINGKNFTLCGRRIRK